MTTDKADPKDIDLLLTVADDLDLAHLASAGRRLKVAEGASARQEPWCRHPYKNPSMRLGATPQSVPRTLEGEVENIHIKHELIEADEYIEFLGRSNLGQQYPMERFAERIQTLVKSVQISLIARNPHQEIVGVCFGLTDFAYWLFLTDLGVDRRYERRGIGKLLVEAAHARAGGEKNIVMFTNVNDEAIPFYQKLGMKTSPDIFAKWNIDWTPFEVAGPTPVPGASRPVSR